MSMDEFKSWACVCTVIIIDIDIVIQMMIFAPIIGAVHKSAETLKAMDNFKASIPIEYMMSQSLRPV